MTLAQVDSIHVDGYTLGFHDEVIACLVGSGGMSIAVARRPHWWSRNWVVRAAHGDYEWLDGMKFRNKRELCRYLQNAGNVRAWGGIWMA